MGLPIFIIINYVFISYNTIQVIKRLTLIEKVTRFFLYVETFCFGKIVSLSLACLPFLVLTFE